MSAECKEKDRLEALKVEDDNLDKVSGGIRICGRDYNQASVSDKELRKGPAKVEIKV